MTGPLRSGQLAAAGVKPQTLRYYERRRLLAAPQRTPGGHRLYPAQSLTLLRIIKTAQRLGFILDEVAELVDLGRHRHGRTDTGLQARAATKITETEPPDQRPADDRGDAADHGGPAPSSQQGTVQILLGLRRI